MTTGGGPAGMAMFAGREPPRPLPVAAPQARAELARLMHELGEHPGDSPAIVRDALDTMDSIAAAAGLAWTRPAGDCAVLDDARAGLAAIWDLLVRADARSLGASPDSLQAPRGDGYGPIVAAVADARARLTAHAGGAPEPVPAHERLSDPWRPDHGPEGPGADTDECDAPLAGAVEQAVAAANAGNAGHEAFQGLRAALEAAFPDTPPPSGAPAGQPRPPAADPDPDCWTPARELLAHARAMAPAPPGSRASSAPSAGRRGPRPGAGTPARTPPALAGPRPPRRSARPTAGSCSRPKAHAGSRPASGRGSPPPPAARSGSPTKGT